MPLQLKLEKRHFPKNLKKCLQIYPTTSSFVRHLLKHVLTPPESTVWSRLLPSQTPCWRELSKERYVRMSAEDMESAGEKQQRLVQAAYADFAKCIESGLSYADETPLYAVLKERIKNQRAGKTWMRDTYVCLSSHGCIMYARNHALRSAFFAHADARSCSPYDLYWAGLHKLLAQAQRAEARTTWYSDEEGVRVTGISVERMTRDTLTQARNPWPRPRETFKEVRLIEDDPLEALVRRKYLRK